MNYSKNCSLKTLYKMNTLVLLCMWFKCNDGAFNWWSWGPKLNILARIIKHIPRYVAIASVTIQNIWVSCMFETYILERQIGLADCLSKVHFHMNNTEEILSYLKSYNEAFKEMVHIIAKSCGNSFLIMKCILKSWDYLGRLLSGNTFCLRVQKNRKIFVIFTKWSKS